MSKPNPARINNRQFSRRDILKLGGGLLGAVAGSVLVPKALMKEERDASAAPLTAVKANLNKPVAQSLPVNKHLVGTDGYIYLPGPAKPPYFPDDTAPEGLNTYIFGYHDVTGLTDDMVHRHKMGAILSGPPLILRENEGYVLKLTNLGLQIRPDLVDAHTIHFHGFRNAIPIFDGEPHSSVGVPIIRDLLYYYMPRNPGTYMYHCHFEETEHVHMGMIGPAFIRPAIGDKYVFDDPETAFDREYLITLSEIWLESHWADSHIQLPEWTDYTPDYFLINGRAYPDTIAPNGSIDLGHDGATGDMIPPSGRPELAFQPMSSLVACNAGDKVALRFIQLGFTGYTMELQGIKMKVIGKDATSLKGADGTDLSYLTHTLAIGPGETVDAIFTAPPHSGGAGPDRYLLFNRRFAKLNNAGSPGRGGQMTEVHVYPAGYLPAQTEPNGWQLP